MKDIAPKPGEYFCMAGNVIFASREEHDANCKFHGITGYVKVETVDHPQHYGGKDNPHETIKCIEAWGLGYALGNAVKYISRAGKKGDTLEDLKKAAWYINHAIEQEEAERG